jgi:hypothetical protein
LSKQDGVSSRFDRSDRYRIGRVPDLMTVTPGAEVRYTCQHRNGQPPAAIGGGATTRDSVRWYKFRARSLLEETRGRDPNWAVPLEKGPFGEFSWYCRWQESPGRYVIGSEISDGGESTFCFLPQYVEGAGLVLGSAFDELGEKVGAPSPAEAEQKLAQHLANLQAIARRFPVTDPDDQRRHDDAVAAWRKYQGALRELLAPTDGRTRIAVPALHLETTTQLQRPLLLFLCHAGDDVVGRSQRKRPRWVLVDWTDPTDSRWHGSYEGVGDTHAEAIAAALRDWDWGNRYPAGRVVRELPAHAFGEAQRAQLQTNGKSLGDEVQGVFEWIAVGGLVVAGALLLFTPVPSLAAAALGVSVLSSTAASGISVGQRWRAGIFDPRQDAIDGLTIIGALFGGAAAWSRGARVLLRGPSAETVARIFVGAQIGSDLVQGVLIAEDCLHDWNDLVEDPELLPEDRSRKLLALFRKLGEAGLLTYISLRAGAAEMEALNDRPRHVASAGGARPAGEKFRELTNPRATVDATRPPEAEGHTGEGRQTTRVRTGVGESPKALGPESFAEFIRKKRHHWEEKVITDEVIELVDQDRFSFVAKCFNGDLDITIVTSVGPESSPHLKRFFGNPTKLTYSEVLRAAELYPRMYAHFAAVGNPVKRLVGMWAWTNYEDCLPKFEELTKGRKMSARKAAKIAVLEARTWKKYHRPQGFTEVVEAEHHPYLKQFSFVIVKPGGAK